MAKTGLHELVHAETTESIKLHIEKQNILAQQNHAANIAVIHNEQKAQEAQKETENWQQAAAMAKREADFYKNLLSQPMHVIAANNEDFKKTYNLQQELLADWMVSQKAFKELAVDLGLELGQTKEAILQAGLNNEEKVLNNNTKHKNNAEDSNIIKPHIEKLKNKLKK